MVKNLPSNAGDRRDTGSIPGLGRSPGEGNDNPLQGAHKGKPLRGQYGPGLEFTSCKSPRVAKYVG